MRSTVAYIHLDRLGRNIDYLLRAVGDSEVCVVLKANAYGHGLVPVSRFLQHYPPLFGRLRLGVATVDEGVALREAGVGVPILLFGYADESDIAAVFRHRLEPFVGDVAYCRQLAMTGGRQKTTDPLPVHIKVDSGMGRMGCSADELPALYRAALESPCLRPEALCTHFADAYDAEYTAEQCAYFDRACASLGEQATGLVRHAANSAFIFRGDAVPCGSSPRRMVRPGILVYGYDSDPAHGHGADLQPVMELRSKIMMLKRVRHGQAISYGMTWRAPRETQIAVIPVGYGDGYTRRLSGSAEVLIKTTPTTQHRAPIVGRICMDHCMVDVGGVPGVAVGMEVVLFGDKERGIGADLLARQSGTIAYEITTAIQARVPRVYVDLTSPHKSR